MDEGLETEPGLCGPGEDSTGEPLSVVDALEDNLVHAAVGATLDFVLRLGVAKLVQEDRVGSKPLLVAVRAIVN